MDIEVMVEGEGLTEVETIRIPEGSVAREIAKVVAVKGGFPVEEAILFIEDCEEPIDLAVVVVEEELELLLDVELPVSVSFKSSTISRTRPAWALAITNPTSVAMAPTSAT